VIEKVNCSIFSEEIKRNLRETHCSGAKFTTPSITLQLLLSGSFPLKYLKRGFFDFS
jgi:hypothetical protein